MTTTLNNPLEKRARIDVVDVLRGFAVMGIILLHSIEHFNLYSFPDTSEQSNFLNFTDKAIWDGLFFLLAGKAYAIFALLFGFTFFLQDDSQKRKGKDFRLRFMWRLVLLFLIGQFNAAFFFGEVLVLYALVGFILVLTCRMSDKAVFALVIIFLLQPIELTKLIMSIFSSDYIPSEKSFLEYWNPGAEVLAEGTFWETIKSNLWTGQIASIVWAWEHGRIFQTGALFMLGMLLGRRGLFVKSDKNIKFWLGVLAVAFLCYFPLIGLTNLAPKYIESEATIQSFNLIFKSLVNFFFMLVLVSSIVLAYYLTTFGKTLAKLIPYGRMSMTNYITQSIIGSLLFYNWGFGLHDDLTITYSFLVGIVLFVAQYAFCNYWMKNHQMGPFESFWKKATWIGSK